MRGVAQYSTFSQVVSRQEPASRSVAVRRKIVRKGIVFIIAIGMTGMMYVWSRIQVITIKHSISQLEHQLEKLQEEIKLSEIDIAPLKASERLEKIARESLHMAPPSQHQIVIVSMPSSGVNP